jgi:hypothetical protein
MEMEVGEGIGIRAFATHHNERVPGGGQSSRKRKAAISLMEQHETLPKIQARVWEEEVKRSFFC